MKLLYFTYAVIADEINTKKDPNCVLVIICYFIWNAECIINIQWLRPCSKMRRLLYFSLLSMSFRKEEKWRNSLRSWDSLRHNLILMLIMCFIYERILYSRKRVFKWRLLCWMSSCWLRLRWQYSFDPFLFI